MSNGEKKSKKGLIIGIIVAVLAVAGGVTGLLVWKNQPKGVTVAITNLPDSLNPILEQNTSGLNADELLFDGLVNFEVDIESGSLYPDLALAEYIEQDTETKKDYTVGLRDITWHDGAPVTAKDVVYSFNAYVNEENKSPKRAYLMSFIKNIDEIDDKTVHIEFVNPIPEFRAYPILTFKIIPATYNGLEMDVNMRAGENERLFATAPIGTGPFKLTEWKIGKWLTFEANGDYYKHVPNADSFVMKRQIDPIIRMNELKKGRINFILETNPLDRETVSKMNDVDINSYLPFAFYQISINTEKFPDAEVRQAMAKALDRKTLVPGITDAEDGVVLNYGPFPSNLFQSTIPEYVNEPMPDLLSYGPEESKDVFESAEMIDENIILMYPDSMGEFGQKLAEGVAKQLNSVGLNVETKRTGDQVFKKMVYKDHSYELALMYCEGFDNVYSSLGDLYRSNGSQNVSGVADPDLDMLFDEWENEVSVKEWANLTLQLNEKICELSPALYLCSLEKDVYSRGLENVVIATDNPFLSVEDWEFK